MGFFSSSPSKVKIPGQVKTAMNYLQGLLKAPSPVIPTREIAGMSPVEAASQDLLTKTMGDSTLGPDWEAAKAGIKEFMGPQDITKTPEYEPLVRRTVEEGNILMNRMGRMIQGYGGLDTSTGGKMLARGVRSQEENILAALAPYSEAARGRRLTAAGTLGEMSQLEGSEPIKRVAAGMTYGQLPRQLSQAEADAIFEQLMQTVMFNYTTKANIAGTLMGAKDLSTVTGGEPSMFSQLAPIIGGILGAGGV